MIRGRECKHYQRELRKRRKQLQQYKKIRRRKRQIRLKLRPYYLRRRKWESRQEDNALYPPTDFRYLQNFEECNRFFYKLINAKPSIQLGSKQPYIKIDCSNVEKIDFTTTCIWAAISEVLKEKPLSYGIYGVLPAKAECRAFIKQSGFLDGKVDEYGRQFPIAKGASKMIIQKGEDRFKDEHVRYFVDSVAEVYKKLNIVTPPAYMVTVIKEICGNSVEWSEAHYKRWTLSRLETPDHYEFVALDLGKGILKSLHLGYQGIIRSMGLSSEKDILLRAFEKKYSSESKEKNRHKGLPLVRKAFLDGKFKGLYVACNNVLLDFENSENTCQIPEKKRQQCPGTIYRWIINKECK